MSRNTHWIAGLLAVAVYLFSVVLGGLLWPNYSHLAQPISDLIAIGAPPKERLDPLFVIYNVLTGVFAVGLARIARNCRPLQVNRVGVAGGWTLVIESLAGLLTLAFPEREGGANASIGATGFAHIFFAGVSSIASLLAILLIGRWLSRAANLNWLWRFSVLAAVVVAATGIVTGIAVANSYALAGLAERLTIGVFLLWQATAAWWSRSITATSARSPDGAA